jgi:hypothetical protein
MSPARVTRVQVELGVRLPADYARFLAECGHVEVNGVCVFGYCEHMPDVNALPCVIGATKRLGPLYGLARHELVLAQDSGTLFVLDCLTGKMLETGLLGRRIAARSFTHWLNGLDADNGLDGCQGHG